MDSQTNDSTPEIYTSPLEVLEDYGAWFCALCLRAIRSHTNRLISDHGGFCPSGVSLSEIFAVLSGQTAPSALEWLNNHEIPEFDRCNELMAIIMSSIQNRTDATLAQTDDSAPGALLPHAQIMEDFNLTETERLILIILTLIQFDERYRRAARYVSGASE